MLNLDVFSIFIQNTIGDTSITNLIALATLYHK